MPSGHPERTILFVEVRSFPLACHVTRDPRLVGRPSVVTHRRRSGADAVLAASVEARRCGVRAGMPVARAVRRCPDLDLVAADSDLYRAIDARLLAVLGRLGLPVESLRPGAAWCDVTGHGAEVGRGLTAAGTFHRRLWAELGVGAAVGAGPNRLLARAAAQMVPTAGPGAASGDHGICALCRADVPVRLWPLPAGDLPGVGPALARRIGVWRIRTIGDIAAMGPGWWRRRLGDGGERMWGWAYGRDDTPVGTGAASSSAWRSTTHAGDVHSVADAQRPLRAAVNDLVAGLRDRGLVAARLTATLRDASGHGRTRTRALPVPSDGPQELLAAAAELVAPLLTGGAAFYSLSLEVGGLQSAERAIRQPSLFDGRPAEGEHRAACSRPGPGPLAGNRLTPSAAACQRAGESPPSATAGAQRPQQAG